MKTADTQVSETNAEGDDDGFDGIASISAKRLTAKATGKPAPAPQASDSDEEDDAPILINRELQHLQAVLDQADAVVEILDARDPLSFHSSHLEEIIGSKAGKKALLVVNKIGRLSSYCDTLQSSLSSIDCAPQESVMAWVSTLRKQQPTFPFRSASACLPGNPLIPKDVKGKGKAKHPADDALGADAILDCLGKWAEEKKGDSPFTVAVVGVTNVRYHSPFLSPVTEVLVLIDRQELVDQFLDEKKYVTSVFPYIFLSWSHYDSHAARNDNRGCRKTYSFH